MFTMDDVMAKPVLAQAYAWLCRQRRDYPPDANIWTFRRRWPQEKVRLRVELLAGDSAI